jgi:hypothetical protein
VQLLSSRWPKIIKPSSLFEYILLSSMEGIHLIWCHGKLRHCKGLPKLWDDLHLGAPGLVDWVEKNGHISGGHDIG